MGMLFSILWVCLSGHAKIIFPQEDLYLAEKQLAMEEVLNVFPKNSALQTVLDSEKIILWANSVQLQTSTPPQILTITEPNFSAVTTNNKDFLRVQIEQSCQCSLMGQEIGGILVASPYHAAEMYFREGWLGHQANEIEGYAPPLAIIYHELAHAGDYLRDQNYFFDIASMSSKQWKNGAEQSAVIQQNDFIRAVNAQKKTRFSSRLSYGKHQLYKTSGLYSIERIEENLF